MRLAIMLLLAGSALVWALQCAWHAALAKPAIAPCPDAMAAYLQEHWECSGLRTYKGQIAFKCIGGDVIISDMIVSSETRKYESFIYTDLHTWRQGVCDCGRSAGKVCELFE